MKRIMLLILVIAVLLMVGCGAPAETAVPEKESLPTQSADAIEDNIIVSFDPNPVPAGIRSGKEYWKYQVTLTETKGVGVTLNTCVVQYYSSDGSSGSPKVYDTKEWFESWLPGAYLPPNGKVNTGGGLPVQAITYGIFTYTGIDDNGREIVAIGRVDLSQ